MSEFKEGDVVQLRSGGPKMTIVKTEGSDEACCVWFIEMKQEGKFKFKNLEMVEESVQPPSIYETQGLKLF